MSANWYKGLTQEAKGTLKETVKHDKCILPRMVEVLEQKIEDSIKRMRKDDCVKDHALLIHEVSLQRAHTDIIEMINQIMKENDNE